MFQNISRIKDIVEMLKLYEGINPSYRELIKVIKDNPMVLEMFDTPVKYSKEFAVDEIARAIYQFRNSK
jgi:hypothetical protein